LERAWDAWQAERSGVARSANDPPAPATRSGSADDHLGLQRTSDKASGELARRPELDRALLVTRAGETS
jgi:hypothetical protein